MYNQISFIALVQQAIKKPLVTELLPRSSYTRGWRCDYNYVQFSYIGQVTFSNYSIANKKTGRRLAMASQQAPHNPQLHSTTSGAQQCTISSAVQVRQTSWLLTGFVARCNRNEESQVLAVPGFR